MLFGYDEAQSLGTEGHYNYAAYEADEPSFGNQPYWSGENDIPSGNHHKESQTAIDKPDIQAAMTDLDDNRNDPTFIYAKDLVRFTETDFSQLATLTKMAQAVGDDKWSDGTGSNPVNVYEGQGYRYKLQLNSGVDSSVSDIIIVDCFDNYKLKAQDEDYDPNGQWSWKGGFKSVDLSQIISMGCAPVVYYYVCDGNNGNVEDLNVSNFNLSNTAGTVFNVISGPEWTTTMPADPEQVKAIAIDCRYDPNGQPYILGENSSLIAYVLMQAPVWQEGDTFLGDVEPRNPDNNAHAFNEVWMDITETSGGTSHVFTNSEYTKIGIMANTLPVSKIWDDANDNDHIRPTEIILHLYADDVDTGRSLHVTATDNWEAEFDHVPKYTVDGIPIVYTLVEEPVTDYTFSSELTDEGFIATNKHTLYTVDVPARKTWSSSEPSGWESNIPLYIVLNLYRDGTFSQRKVLRPDLNGNWETLDSLHMDIRKREPLCNSLLNRSFFL